MLSDKAASIVSKSWKSKATSVRLLRFTMSSVSIAFVLVFNGIAMSAKTPTSLKKALSRRVVAILLVEKRRSDDPGFRGCRKVDQVDQERLVTFGPDRREVAEKVIEGVPKMKSVRVVEVVPQMKVLFRVAMFGEGVDEVVPQMKSLSLKNEAQEKESGVMRRFHCMKSKKTAVQGKN